MDVRIFCWNILNPDLANVSRWPIFSDIGFIVDGIGHSYGQFTHDVYEYTANSLDPIADIQNDLQMAITNHALDNTLWLAVVCARIDWNNTMRFHCPNSANTEIPSRHDVSFLRSSKTLVLSAWLLFDSDISTKLSIKLHSQTKNRCWYFIKIALPSVFSVDAEQTTS
jgi:hypothetical protein